MTSASANSESSAVPREVSSRPVDSRVQIRHAALKVADLERTKRFYVDVLGFHVMAENDISVLISASGYHHDVAFFSRESRDGVPAPYEATGLDHIAFLYPDKETFSDALRRIAATDCQVEFLSEFAGHIGLLFRDPDFIRIELYFDKPVDEWWSDEDGHLVPMVKPVRLEDLGLNPDEFPKFNPEVLSPRPITGKD